MKKKSDNKSKNNKQDSDQDNKLENIFNPEYHKTSQSKLSSFVFNIYKKGKRLSRQLDKLKNGFSDFLYELSLESNKDDKKETSKSKFYNQEIDKNEKLKIKIDNSNSLSLKKKTKNNGKENIEKKTSLTVPKIKIENQNQVKDNSKAIKQKYVYTSKEFRKTNLNKLYGYNKRYFTFKDNLKKSKDSELETYQDNILRLSSINLSRDNLLKLYSDLKTIRINSEEVKPLPPINFRTIITHSLTKKKKLKRGGYLPKSKKYKEMDDYEKEMYRIKVNNRHEKYLSNNKFIYKMYEILPEHIVEKIYVKKKKF